MRIKECFENRLLRKINPDFEKAKISIKISEKKLNLTRKCIEANIFESCIIESYTSMFHAARALLYRDGVQEKSHKCVVVYLIEKYSKILPTHLINSLDVHRTDRHELLYGLGFEPTKEDCETAIEDAEEFVVEIKKLLDVQRNK